MKNTNIHNADKTVSDYKNHNDLIDKQFGSQASLYLQSNVHASGQEFALMAQQVEQFQQPTILDLGCGAGHVSFNVAPLAQKVIAYDLSKDMLNLVAKTAKEKGLNNIAIEKGIAESLPFAEDSFDMVISRFSAHHWQDVPQALKEVRRVCKPDAKVMIVDVMSPANPLYDSFLQTIEMLRDTSHVRDYSAAQWQAMFAYAGLEIQSMQTRKLVLDFASWITRMRTPDHFVTSIRALQQGSSQDLKNYFDIQEDGSFTLDVVTFIASV
ncbi:class I SAM-dependent methyltransferase [Neisseria montereyensis]|uniref:Class I SAM-dependent methyltransferase n=1 Tax=Neisseria montereyensis TaxID=2973938 RepID=A0ABT2FAU3_9NEIS|nr:class I SAM-dependent methyltransferase [Neisseria montereyensis]MCS4533258.1 class I SAM-dependent methyltransferase [Neisseria montereyensis]